MRVAPLLSAIFLVILFYPLGQTSAADVVVKTNKKNYRIGDIITLTAEISGNGHKLADMVESELAPFELESKEEIYDEESRKTRFIISGRIFRTGRFSLPPLVFIDSEGIEQLKSDAIPVEIVSLLNGDEKDIRDIKPQTEVSEKGPLWPWIAVIILLAAAVIIYIFFRRKNVTEAVLTEAVEMPPHVAALEELQRIEKMDLIRSDRIKELYTLASDAVRIFEGKLHSIDAMELTTGELTAALESKGAKGFSDLKRFLEDCDMVKFADYNPPRIDMDGLIERARRIVGAGFRREMSRGKQYSPP